MPKLRIKPVKPKPTPEEIAKANAFAKDFTARKNLMIAKDAHVGKSLPPFVDEKGNDVTGTNKLPPRTITDINKIPSHVKELKSDSNGIPYYTDETTGDVQYVHPDIARSSRFNPNRGKSKEDLIAKR